jgi:hypothetical protein
VASYCSNSCLLTDWAGHAPICRLIARREKHVLAKERNRQEEETTVTLDVAKLRDELWALGLEPGINPTRSKLRGKLLQVLQLDVRLPEVAKTSDGEEIIRKNVIEEDPARSKSEDDEKLLEEEVNSTKRKKEDVVTENDSELKISWLETSMQELVNFVMDTMVETVMNIKLKELKEGNVVEAELLEAPIMELVKTALDYMVETASNIGSNLKETSKMEDA